MATCRTIQDELDRARILLQRPVLDAELSVIAAEWAETMRDITDDTFIAAMRHHRRKSRYWPTEADIRQAVSEISEAQSRERQRKTPDAYAFESAMPPDEQCSRNAKWARKLLDSLFPVMRGRQ